MPFDAAAAGGGDDDGCGGGGGDCGGGLALQLLQLLLYLIFLLLLLLLLFGVIARTRFAWLVFCATGGISPLGLLFADGLSRSTILHIRLNNNDFHLNRESTYADDFTTISISIFTTIIIIIIYLL